MNEKFLSLWNFVKEIDCHSAASKNDAKINKASNQQCFWLQVIFQKLMLQVSPGFQTWETFETTGFYCFIVFERLKTLWNPKQKFLKLLLQQRKLVEIIIWISFLNSAIRII